VELLDFLVTSRARRSLLREYLGGGLDQAVSVSEVARRSRLQPSSADRELKRMEACGLVSSERVGKEKRVRTNAAAAARLRDALAASNGRGPASSAVRTRTALAFYGAPLVVGADDVGQPSRLEAAVADGLRLAHSDPSVAGNLPVVLSKNPEVDVAELSRLALLRGEGQTLGFFLELTDELSGSDRFAEVAKSLRDGRVRGLKNFFSFDGRFRPLERELAEVTTPETARRWNFLMNMSTDSFRSYFRKGTGPTVSLEPS
jgi:DNA-binding transcriptional ArsR family regulator